MRPCGRSWRPSATCSRGSSVLGSLPALAEERSTPAGTRAAGPVLGVGVAAVACLCVVLPGLLLGGDEGSVAGLVWVALVGLPAGCLASGLPRWPWSALGGLAVGLGALLARDGTASAASGVSLAGLGAGLLGLLLIGFGIGRGGAAHAPRLALALAALVLGLELAPRGFLAAERPPASADPALGRLLFDAAPSTWVLEAAGVDWMRHPSNYDSAGTDWFSGARAPFRAGLAGGSLLVLGCVTAAAGCALHRRAAQRGPKNAPSTTRDTVRASR